MLFVDNGMYDVMQFTVNVYSLLALYLRKVFIAGLTINRVCRRTIINVNLTRVIKLNLD